MYIALGKIALAPATSSRPGVALAPRAMQPTASRVAVEPVRPVMMATDTRTDAAVAVRASLPSAMMTSTGYPGGASVVPTVTAAPMVSPAATIPSLPRYPIEPVLPSGRLPGTLPTPEAPVSAEPTVPSELPEAADTGLPESADTGLPESAAEGEDSGTAAELPTTSTTDEAAAEVPSDQAASVTTEQDQIITPSVSKTESRSRVSWLILAGLGVIIVSFGIYEWSHSGKEH